MKLRIPSIRRKSRMPALESPRKRSENLPARSARRRKLYWFAASFAGGLLAVTAAQWYVLRHTDPYIYQDIAAVPFRPVGIVFGARVHENGQLSNVLRARVEAGIHLYRAGKVKKLLMTGDNSRQDYDEVTAMKKYAVDHGVLPQDIVRDYAGFRTFDSCYRALHIFQVDRATLVTQAYHLPRALFTARSLGMDSVGFAADPGVDNATLARFRVRESLATLTALLDTGFPDRRPRFLGRPEPIFSDERSNR